MAILAKCGGLRHTCCCKIWILTQPQNYTRKLEQELDRKAITDWSWQIDSNSNTDRCDDSRHATSRDLYLNNDRIIRSNSDRLGTTDSQDRLGAGPKHAIKTLVSNDHFVSVLPTVAEFGVYIRIDATCS